MDKVKLFIEETKMHIKNFNIDFNVDELLMLNDSLVKENIINSNCIVSLAIVFAKAIAIGEVTKEIFEHNLNSFKNILISLKENKLKEMFKSNVDPRLFMSTDEIENKICVIFDESLQKTKEVKEQQEKEMGDSLEQLASLFKGLDNPTQMTKNFLATKKKNKKKNKK